MNIQLDTGILLKSHVNKFLGIHSKGWKDERSGIVVTLHKDVPDEGLDTFITIGLSKHLYIQDGDNNPIRLELMCTTLDENTHLPYEKILFTAAKYMTDRGTPYLNGEVLGPNKDMFPDGFKPFSALYCGSPGFYPEEFSFIQCDEPIVFVEVSPITFYEAGLIYESGSDNFELLLEQGKIDILSFDRK